MNNYSSMRIFNMLARMPGFTMTDKQMSVAGFVFIWNAMYIEDAIVEAYVFFQSEIRAAELVVERSTPK